MVTGSSCEMLFLLQGELINQDGDSGAIRQKGGHILQGLLLKLDSDLCQQRLIDSPVCLAFQENNFARFLRSGGDPL